MNRRRFVTSALALSTAVAAPGLARAQTPVASPVASTTFTMVDVEGEPLVVSPDGSMIAGIDRDEAVCVWDASTLEVIEASDPAPEIGIIDRQSLAWAPDSGAVAWSLNTRQLFIDSDIFVFDLVAGTTTNLTPDAAQHEPASRIGDASPEAPMTVDQFPAWSPDSTNLAFARATYGDPDNPSIRLCITPRDGGPITENISVSDSYPVSVTPGMKWNDDDTILYSTGAPSSEIALNGIFRAAIDGTNIETINSGLLAATTPWAILSDVAPEAHLASIVAAGNFGTLSGGVEEGVYFLVDMRTGIPTRFEDVLDLPTEFESIDDGLRLDAAPAIMMNDDGIPTFIYLTVGWDHLSIWSRRIDASTSTELAVIERQEDDDPRLQWSRIEVANNGTIMLTHWSGAWIST